MSGGGRENDIFNHRNLQQGKPPPEKTQQEGQSQTIPGLEGIDVCTLQKLLATAEGKESIPDVALSPFSFDVREAPLSLAFRGTRDLCFNGSTDPSEYLWAF